MINTNCQLKVTTNHTGKMEGITSISTSPTINCRCNKNAQIKGTICVFCYARRMLKRYKNLALSLERNYYLLTSEILPLENLPRFNTLYNRLESFGDIANHIHFINYLNICRVNPHVRFTIWTKNPDIMDFVFNELGQKKPSNLNIVVSSLFINVPFQLENMPYYERYKTFIDFIFTVYEKEYAQQNGIVINCGSKKCLSCLLCYKPKETNEIIYINELKK